jgi:hypothetical protein
LYHQSRIRAGGHASIIPTRTRFLRVHKSLLYGNLDTTGMRRRTVEHYCH